MLDKIIYFSIHNKLVIGIMAFALAAWGIYSLSQLPIDAVPDITNNQVQVITISNTLAAQEVERLITFPVEITMATIPGIEEIRSFSRFGLSVVTIVFKDNIDIYWARQQVNERLTEAESQIPKGIGKPGLAPVTTGLGEIYQYVLHPKKGYEGKYSSMDLRTIQDWTIRRALLGTPGVADISSFGGHLKQYEIAVQPDKLHSSGVSIAELFTALENNNQNTGGSYIEKGPTAYFIRSEGLVQSLDDIGNIVVKTTSAGFPVLVKDLAEVRYGSALRFGAMTRNGESEVVGAVVMMLKGANSSEVIKLVKQRIAEIQKTLPEGLVIEPFLDRTKLVDHAIGTVTKNLIEGALIVIFILILLLGNFRAGLIVASVIPLAMLFAISMMNLFGISGNLMSLGAIDFGLIVDGAVIIVESIVHRISHSVNPLNQKRLTAQQMDKEVYAAATKIRNSAAFGEIIILIVYLPILALSGIEGKMFKPMAQTVSFAIIGAFILSLTYVPMMTALFLSKNTSHKRNISDRIIDRIQQVYSPVIAFAMRKKAAVLIFGFSMLLISIFVFMRMGGEFIPTLDEGDFAVETRVITGSSINETIEASKKASKILIKKFPEINQIVAKIGSSEIPTDPMPVEACDLMIILKDKDEWVSASTRDELAALMAKELEALPGVTFSFQQPIQMRFNELMTGAKQDVVLKIYGDDLEKLTDYSQEIGKIVQPVEGVQDVYVEEITGLPQVLIKFKRDRIAQFGLSIQQVNSVIKTAFAGETAGLVFEGEKRFDLVVRLEKESRQDIEHVKSLFVTLPNGGQIPLDQVAEVVFKPGPNQIQREQARRRIIVGFNVRGRDVESIVNEIQTKIESQVKFDEGYSVTYGGQFENLEKAKSRLSIALPIALLLIFVLLFFTFKSIKQSILIFTAIPLSAIGGIFALSLRGMPFSISAGVGFIALFGVAVLNGIVLIAEFNRLKNEGIDNINEIIFKGTALRLRPVVMTAAVASLGFLPMALSNSSGAEVQQPLATVVIGGLISATLLTLVLLPVLYAVFEKGLRKTFRQYNKFGAVLVLVFFLSQTYKTANAQQVTTGNISMKDAIEMALKNNRGIKSLEYDVDLQKVLKRTAFDISKTNVSYTRGQYNSANKKDNNITVTQNLSLPLLYSANNGLAKANIKSSEFKLLFQQKELIKNVKSAYMQLLYLLNKQRLLQSQDSLVAPSVKAAQIRFKTGETNLLEKATAEAQEMELKTLLMQNNSAISAVRGQLSTLLNSSQVPQIQDESLNRLDFDLSRDRSVMPKTAAVDYLQQQVEVISKSGQVEKAKVLPDLSVGYFNQTLTGFQNINGTDQYFGPNNRFTGFMLGMAIPLGLGSQIAKVKAAGINKIMAENDYEYALNNMQTQYNQAMQEFLKQKASLSYFEKNALPLADLIVLNAQKSLQMGDIDYSKYAFSMNQALAIKSGYLETLNNFNQAVILLDSFE